VLGSPFILPGTTYPVYSGAVVVLRIISYTRVTLMTNDRPTARPTTSANAVVVVASSLVPATRSSSQFSSAVKSRFCKANFVACDEGDDDDDDDDDAGVF
jgi:hypothetical protein